MSALIIILYIIVYIMSKLTDLTAVERGLLKRPRGEATNIENIKAKLAKQRKKAEAIARNRRAQRADSIARSPRHYGGKR